MALERSGPFSGVVMQPRTDPIRSLIRLCHIAPIAHQVNESRVGKHRRELGQDFDVEWCLVSPAGLTFGFYVKPIDDFNQIAQIWLPELRHFVSEVTRVQ